MEAVPRAKKSSALSLAIPALAKSYPSLMPSPLSQIEILGRDEAETANARTQEACPTTPIATAPLPPGAADPTEEQGDHLLLCLTG
jgi:hypothetical protein